MYYYTLSCSGDAKTLQFFLAPYCWHPITSHLVKLSLPNFLFLGLVSRIVAPSGGSGKGIWRPSNLDSGPSSAAWFPLPSRTRLCTVPMATGLVRWPAPWRPRPRLQRSPGDSTPWRHNPRASVRLLVAWWGARAPTLPPAPIWRPLPPLGRHPGTSMGGSSTPHPHFHSLDSKIRPLPEMGLDVLHMRRVHFRSVSTHDLRLPGICRIVKRSKSQD